MAWRLLLDGDCASEPLQTLLKKADAKAWGAGNYEFDYAGEQKYRSRRGVGSSGLSSFTQSFTPAHRVSDF